MKDKTMKNGQIIDIINALNNPEGKSLYEKKLPPQLLFNLRRSVQSLNAAYKDYTDSLVDLCKQNGATDGEQIDDFIKSKPELLSEIGKLLSTDTTVRIYTVPSSVIMECDGDRYDVLPYSDIDRLFWLIEDEE